VRPYNLECCCFIETICSQICNCTNEGSEKIWKGRSGREKWRNGRNFLLKPLSGTWQHWQKSRHFLSSLNWLFPSTPCTKWLFIYISGGFRHVSLLKYNDLKKSPRNIHCTLGVVDFWIFYLIDLTTEFVMAKEF
jgi:hypothetical protein